ncbi:MAG: radical SAM protein, partial [Proteobacteria bacterium]|nr:radical SAM protein [Pseudomonadota bacterium]MBU1612372.1 radical SAM protein [Pseudomonadota bacterium]
HHESDYDFDGFLFLNEMFYPSLKTVKEFTSAYKASGIGRPWQCSMRVDMPLDCLELMKDAGCVIVGVGYESGNNNVLEKMRKNSTTDQVRAFLRKAKEVGLYVYATFMFGSELETETEIAQTMDLLLEEKTYGGGAFVTIYPGTKIYDNAYDKGLFTDKKEHLEHLDFFNSVVAGNILKPGYINISNIPDKYELNKAALRHYSRYRGGIHGHLNIDAPNFAAATGRCPSCGAELEMRFYVNTMYVDHRSCPACRHPVFMDFYHHPPFDEHKRMLQHLLEGKKKIAVVGQGPNSLGILTTDVFINDPERVALVIGDHPMHADGRFLIYPVKPLDELQPGDADCVLIADANSACNTARRLVELGFGHCSAVVLPPNWPSFVKKIKERSENPWDTVRLYFPAPDDVYQCQNLYQRIARHIVRTHGEHTKVCLAPAGRFSVNMGKVFVEHGLEVTAYMDNFLAENEINGIPLHRPTEIKHLPPSDIVLVATPNCFSQERIVEGLREHFIEDNQDKFVLLADIYLDKFIEDYRQCQAILDTQVTT